MNNLTAGGTIDMLLDGTEGAANVRQHRGGPEGPRLLQEDPGNQAHIAKVWRYDRCHRQLTVIAQHNPALFTMGAPGFLTQDEESSGIIDAGT